MSTHTGSDEANPADPAKPIDAEVRRVVGVAALRRIGRLVDAERAQDEANARAVPRVILLVVVVVVLLLVSTTPLQRVLGALL